VIEVRRILAGLTLGGLATCTFLGRTGRGCRPMTIIHEDIKAVQERDPAATS